jgi:hypothetical protein
VVEPFTLPLSSGVVASTDEMAQVLAACARGGGDLQLLQPIARQIWRCSRAPLAELLQRAVQRGEAAGDPRGELARAHRAALDDATLTWKVSDNFHWHSAEHNYLVEVEVALPRSLLPGLPHWVRESQRLHGDARDERDVRAPRREAGWTFHGMTRDGHPERMPPLPRLLHMDGLDWVVVPWPNDAVSGDLQREEQERPWKLLTFAERRRVRALLQGVSCGCLVCGLRQDFP